MNQDESIAEAYLKKHHENIVYEPDGNIPPDFSIGRSIGVEVRRLNQQHRDNGNTRGLEEQRIPLNKAVENELSKYALEQNGDSYWLTLRYERNIGSLKDIKQNTVSAVQAFQLQNENIPFKYKLSENVTLEFVAKAQKLSRKFKIGIELDQDSGGWVVDMYTQDVIHCIKEKEQKIKPYKNQYKSWWLLLVDHINCMDSYDKNDIVEKVTKPSSFEKIVVIKHDGTMQFEI